MNIGSLIRGLLGDSKPGEPKSLELKEGQIVRGVVLSVSDSGKEAVVQIQGTPVRAELETPLQPGQTLNLQVAPPGEGGLPVLKPVSLGEAALVSPQSMGEALESLGLSDSKAGREIVQAMQSGGLVLTKETAAKLDAVMNAKPAGVPAAEWLEAAVISVKRGLPVTAESVKGLQQAVFGPQLHQLLATLEESLSLWAGQEAGKSELPTVTGEQKLTAPQASGTASASNVGVTDAGNEQAVNSQTGKAGTQTMGVVSEEQPVTAGAIQVADPGNKANPTGSVAAPSLAKSETGGSGAAAVVNAPEASENNAGTVAGRIAADIGKTEAVANTNISKGNTAAEPAEVSTPVSGNNSANSVVTNEDGAETEQSRTVVRSGVAPERTETTGAAAPGAALAGDAAGKIAARGTALLAKLQGVLTELRGTVPQLAVAPPAGAAGQEQAPAAIVPPQGAVTAPPAGAAEPKQAPAATVPPQGAVTAPPAGTAEPKQAPAAIVPPQGATTAPPATAAGQPATPDIESWVGRVLKLLGAEHEQQAVRGGAASVAAEARPAAAVLAAAGGREAQLVPAALGQTLSGGDHAADTLKGLLLQVLGSSDVPPAVKEAAGQLVQQLTGQQLLLNTDRTAPFAQVTLFLPLQGPDGQETASVHIQSRRGRKGELDAANCRLWFDLNMKQLGQTLVDVQVVDRMVNLKLHNNDPWVLELLEQSRDDIKTSVESIGYQLSGLRTEPLPEKNSMNDPNGKNAGKLADYVPDSYKGVDFRI